MGFARTYEGLKPETIEQIEVNELGVLPVPMRD